MPNPYVNKVVYGDQTLIDLTSDDVLPADVRQGVHFHGADGAPQIGTSSGGGGTPYAIISVTYPAGSTCTCTKGSMVLMAEGTGGKFNFGVPEAGEWTLYCTDGSDEATDYVTISNQYQITEKTLTYYTDPVLNNNLWKKISTVAQQGLAGNFWAVGDRKAIILNGAIGDGLTLTNYATYVYILGFNHNGAANTIDFGTFKTALTGGVDVALRDSKYPSSIYSGTYFNINNSSSNTEGWKGCRMRYYLLGSTNSNGADAGSTTATSPVANTLMAALPSDLRQVMKPMTIWTDNVGGGGHTQSKVTTTIDFLPLLAPFEELGQSGYANSYEKNHQQQYTYYVNGNSKIKFQFNAPTTVCQYWNRSPSYHASDSFCYIYNDGSSNPRNTTTCLGICPIFRV